MKKIISLILVSLVGIAATFAIDHSEMYTTKVGYGNELLAKMKEQYDVIEYTSSSVDIATAEGIREEEKKALQQKDAIEYQQALNQAIAENKVLIVKQTSIMKMAEKQNSVYYTTNPTDDISISCQKNKPMLSINTDEGIEYQFRNLPEMKDTDYFKLCREIKVNKVKKTYKQTAAGKQKQKDDAAAQLPGTVVGIGVDAILTGIMFAF